MNSKVVTPKRAAVVIEGTPPRADGQDEPILSEFFKMIGWISYSKKVYNHSSAGENRDAFLKALLESRSWFIHISSHGSGIDLTIGLDDREATISLNDIKRYCRRKELTNPLKGRMLTISACGNISPSFALGLLKCAGATAVIAPLGKVGFGESALFAMMFYFSLLGLPDSQRSRRHADRLAQYIDSFSRAKTAYLNIGGTGAYRLDYQ